MLSVIIPTLNAAATLPQTLACLEDGGKLVSEIIVVDGGSEDETLSIAHDAGVVVLRTAPGRGAQLKAGADRAHRHWMLFLHADTVLTEDWAQHIRRHMVLRRARAGYFILRFNDKSIVARIWGAGVAFRSAVFALPYGDQGLFIHRDLYRKVGGYRDLPLMEDVDLVRRLGRGRLKCLDAVAVTSAHRYREEGYWRRSIRHWQCLLRFLMGQPMDKIVAHYYASDARTMRDTPVAGHVAKNKGKN